MENRYWNQWNPVKLLTDSSKKLAFDDTQQQDSFSMIWRVPTTLHFLPSHHTHSMEERNERSSALGTTYMWCSMWIHAQPVRLIFQPILKDRWYEQSRRSCNSCPNKIGFLWREICTSVRTLHNIHVKLWILSPYDWISSILTLSITHRSRVAFGTIHFNFPSLGLQ
jgi:hypothetical protein